MEDQKTFSLTELQMSYISGSGSLMHNLFPSGLNINVAPKINLIVAPNTQFNIGMIIIAGNNVSAPITAILNQGNLH
jgi:hypothetical protein